MQLKVRYNSTSISRYNAINRQGGPYSSMQPINTTSQIIESSINISRYRMQSKMQGRDAAQGTIQFDIDIEIRYNKYTRRAIQLNATNKYNIVSQIIESSISISRYRMQSKILQEMQLKARYNSTSISRYNAINTPYSSMQPINTTSQIIDSSINISRYRMQSKMRTDAAQGTNKHNSTSISRYNAINSRRPYSSTKQ